MSESPSKVVLKDVRFSYAHVFKENKKGKFSISIIISKTATETKKDLDAAFAHVLGEVKAKNNGKLPVGFKMILRDGDIDRPDDPAYKNCWFMNASSSMKPGLVNRIKEPIIEQDQFKSGDYGHVAVNIYAYDKDGSRGVTAGLNNIMKTRDGEALSGRATADEDFAGINDSGDDLLA